MKKRTAFIGAILSLIPISQPLLFKTGVALSISAVLFDPEKVNAGSANFYFNSAFKRGLPRILLSNCFMLILLILTKSFTLQYFSTQILTILWLSMVITLSGISYFACLKFLGILDKNFWVNDFSK